MRMKALKMQRYGLVNELNYFCPGFTHGNTSREVWNIRTKTLWTFFNDNSVFHMLILLQTGLFQDIF